VSIQINKLPTEVSKADPARSKAPKKKKRTMFYAVLQGRSPGVIDPG
jgi:hypothetical protein